MRFRDIPPFTMAHYKVDVSLQEIERTLASYQKQGLALEPDFQRGHVWTETQQIRYVEYLLREGVSGRAIYFNQPGWMKDWHGDFVLVDGLQRLTACLRFLRNKIPAFGSYVCEYEGPPPLGARLEFYPESVTSSVGNPQGIRSALKRDQMGANSRRYTPRSWIRRVLVGPTARLRVQRHTMLPTSPLGDVSGRGFGNQSGGAAVSPPRSGHRVVP